MRDRRQRRKTSNRVVTMFNHVQDMIITRKWTSSRGAHHRSLRVADPLYQFLPKADYATLKVAGQRWSLISSRGVGEKRPQGFHQLVDIISNILVVALLVCVDALVTNMAVLGAEAGEVKTRQAGGKLQLFMTRDLREIPFPSPGKGQAADECEHTVARRMGEVSSALETCVCDKMMENW